MYFVVIGVTDTYGKKTIVGTVTEGGFIGAQALYRQAHGFSCKARTDCELYAWRRNDMLAIFETYPSIYERFLALAKQRSEKFREAYQMLQNKGRRTNNINTMAVTNVRRSLTSLTEIDKSSSSKTNTKGR